MLSLVMQSCCLGLGEPQDHVVMLLPHHLAFND